LAKFVNGLIRICNQGDWEPVAPHPGKNLNVLRIAVLAFVNEHFSEARVKSCTKSCLDVCVCDLSTCFNPCVTGTERAVPPQSSAGGASCLLVRRLILNHVIPKRLDPDTIRVDTASRRIKHVQAHPGSRERATPLKPNLYSQRSPAINDIRTRITAGDAAWKNEEVPDKRIEGANIVGVSEDPLERYLGAPARELF
jgi:hypothetical protein